MREADDAKKDKSYVEIQFDESQNKKNRIVKSHQDRIAKQAPKDAYLGEKNQIFDRQMISKQDQRKDSKTPSGQAAKEKNTQGLSHLGVPLFDKPVAQRDPKNDNWAVPEDQYREYIKGMAEGEYTALNTKEYIFFSYFQRIRERLDRAWVPILREKLRKHYMTGRMLASDMEHVTRVQVILNDRGEITGVHVLTESGYQDLDAAAVAAFRKAGPFPNPPKGIVDKNQEIKIPWDFVLKT